MGEAAATTQQCLCEGRGAHHISFRCTRSGGNEWFGIYAEYVAKRPQIYLEHRGFLSDWNSICHLPPFGRLVSDSLLRRYLSPFLAVHLLLPSAPEASRMACELGTAPVNPGLLWLSFE